LTPNEWEDIPNPNNHPNIAQNNEGRRLKRILAKEGQLSDADLKTIADKLVSNWTFNPPPEYLTARISIELIQTMRAMDRSSTRLNKVMVGLTIVILLLTVVMAYAAFRPNAG
jgi:hypothetical protein